MLSVSLFSPRGVRRFALVLFLVAVCGMVAVHFFGPEIARRAPLARFAGHSFQPSEFAKPAFVVLSAWLFAESERTRRTCRPCRWPSPDGVLFAGSAVSEPDVGQTLLITLVWGDAVLPFGAAAAGRRHHRRPAAPLGFAVRLLDLRARALPRRQVFRPDARRQLAARPRHQVVLRGRLLRPRARRGHHQDRAARRPHRLHLCRRRRGVRRHRLPRAARPFRLRRHARAASRRRRSRTRRRGCRSRAWRSCSDCRR